MMLITERFLQVDALLGFSHRCPSPLTNNKYWMDFIYEDLVLTSDIYMHNWEVY